MKFTIFLFTLSVFFSCTNEPLQPSKLDKTELENAQKAYENSTIQHQTVQSKSYYCYVNYEMTGKGISI